VRHGCFCAHPYLVRLLGLSGEDLERFRVAARHHDRSSLPGAVRASSGISTSAADIERFLAAVRTMATTECPLPYVADPLTGDYWPDGHARPDSGLRPSSACSPG